MDATPTCRACWRLLFLMGGWILVVIVIQEGVVTFFERFEVCHEGYKFTRMRRFGDAKEKGKENGSKDHGGVLVL